MALKIHGKVVEKETGKGIPDLTVKAIDKDLLFDDLLGAVTTDENGSFEIRYDKEDSQELFLDKKPDIYLQIKNSEGEVIHTTENKVRYEAGETEEFIVRISRSVVERIMEELTAEIRKLLRDYNPTLVTTVLDREIMRGDLEGVEVFPQVHVHVGGKKE